VPFLLSQCRGKCPAADNEGIHMKVAVVGCGAVGSYYGAKLARAGRHVHFLLRSDYAVLSGGEVEVRSPDGNFRVRPGYARLPEEVGPSDVVLIGLKTTANHTFQDLLPPLVSATTLVVTLQNGLGNEEQLARLFAPSQIAGGLCFVCLNRLKPGLIQHIAHGLIVLGRFRARPDERLKAVEEAFRAAGVPCSLTDDLARAHWEKLTWNIPFNGLGVAGAAGYEAVMSGRILPERTIGRCLTTDRLLAEPRWERVVRELISEVVEAGRALGLGMSPSLADEQIGRTRSMGPYKASTLLDFEQGKELELNSLFLEPLRQARSAGVETPRLAALCEVLQSLDRRRRLPAGPCA
jgi:2-dehydropantoate 2-reductase